jgi:hypothetical protein
MSVELERMRKAAVVACCWVLSRHLPGGAEKNYEIFEKILSISEEIQTYPCMYRVAPDKWWANILV